MRGFVVKALAALVVAVSLASIGVEQVAGQVTDSTFLDGDNDLDEATVTTEDDVAVLRTVLEEAGPRLQKSGVRQHFELTQMVSRRLDVGRGYGNRSDTSNGYAGNPYRLLLNARLLVTSRVTLRAGVEKDPGELLNPPGISGSRSAGFYTATLSVSDIGPFETLAVGDYTVHWAWGLLIGRPSFGILSRPLRPRSSRVTPYRGFSESGFLRGAALTVGQAGTWGLTLFASSRRIDAQQDTTARANGDGGYRLASSGDLHRTATERARQSALGMSTTGGLVSVQSGPLTAGLAAYSVRFSDPVLRGERPDQGNDFSGSDQWGASALLSIRTRRVVHNTEVAIVEGQLSGIVAGTVVPASSSWTLWQYYRSISGSAVSLLGSVPRRGGAKTGRETGMTFGVRWRPTRTSSVSASYDQHGFDVLRYNAASPTSGHRWDLTVELRSHDVEVLLRSGYVVSEVAQHSLDARGAPVRTTVRKDTWRYSFLARLWQAYRFGLDFRYIGTDVRSRASGRGRGHMLAVDMRTSPCRWLTITGRYALFDSESGDSRLYIYEGGLKYEFSIPSFAGTGDRWYVAAHIRPSGKLDARLKYSRSRWPGVLFSGSGLDQVPGDRIRSAAVEVRIAI